LCAAFIKAKRYAGLLKWKTDVSWAGIARHAGWLIGKQEKME